MNTGKLLISIYTLHSQMIVLSKRDLGMGYCLFFVFNFWVLWATEENNIEFRKIDLYILRSILAYCSMEYI